LKKAEADFMASTTQGASPDNPSGPERKTVSFGGMIEPATKMLTLFVVGSYALGYLIVVINENAHGFLETSLIKPRAVTAGALFILFTALPISITQGTFFGKDPNPESKLETFTRFLLGFVDYVAACSAAGLVMLLVFKDDLHGVSMTYGKAIAFMGLFFRSQFKWLSKIQCSTILSPRSCSVDRVRAFFPVWRCLWRL
jgi:hypothetical protein